MAGPDLNELIAFLTVAREHNFTRAAARMGVSQSALSRRVRALEERLGLQLLNRTTRSVATTEAGQRLVAAAAPRLDDIAAEMEALSELRARPAGNVRITATDYAANQYVWPRLRRLLAQHPDVNVEIVSDYGLANIVEQRFDIGIRLGDQVEKDMVAVRVGPDETMAIVASPAYLKGRAAPGTPRDLTAHRCINLRLPTMNSLLPWELRKGRRTLEVRVTGQLAFNNSYQMLTAALEDFGLAYLPRPMVVPHVMAGRLAFVLEDWCPTFTGHHAFYVSRKASPAVRLVIEALKA